LKSKDAKLNTRRMRMSAESKASTAFGDGP